MTPYAAPAETAALMANAQRTLYGRCLRSVQGREQTLALAVAQTLGSTGYAEAVHTQAGIFRSDRNAVIHFWEFTRRSSIAVPAT